MILDTIWMFKDHLWPTKQKCQKFINHGYLHSCCIIANVSENLGMCWYIIGTTHIEIGWTHNLRECLNSRTYTGTHFLTKRVWLQWATLKFKMCMILISLNYLQNNPVCYSTRIIFQYLLWWDDVICQGVSSNYGLTLLYTLEMFIYNLSCVIIVCIMLSWYEI